VLKSVCANPKQLSHSLSFSLSLSLSLSRLALNRTVEVVVLKSVCATSRGGLRFGVALVPNPSLVPHPPVCFAVIFFGVKIVIEGVA